MDPSKVLEVATMAGKIILKNGGETYRVEDTVCRICNAYGFEAQCFATITGIMSSIVDESGVPTTLVVRINKRTTNLDKIDMINALSREIKKYTPKDLVPLIKEIDNRGTYSSIKSFLAHCFGAASFTGMFGGDHKDFLCAFVIGGLVYFLKKWSRKLDLNQYLMYSAGGCIATLVAFLFGRYNMVTSIDTTIIGSMMLLVPGMAITNAIRDVMAGDLVAGMARAAESFIIATCLAIGSGIALTNLLG